MNNNNFLTKLKNHYNSDSFTENGAKNFLSTLVENLDLFFVIGGKRHIFKEKVLKASIFGDKFKYDISEEDDFYNVEDLKEFDNILLRSSKNDMKATLAIILYNRDIINGSGERDITRYSLLYLLSIYSKELNSQYKIKLILKAIEALKDLGRWDDLIFILYYASVSHLISLESMKPLFELIKNQFEKDIKSKNPSLLGKWMYSSNATSKISKKISGFTRKVILKDLNLTESDYRKSLSKLRKTIKIVENNLREKDYTFSYESVPSMAMKKYRKAFYRNDSKRYTEFMNKVERGEAKINTKALSVFDIVREIRKSNPDTQLKDLNLLWENLPNLFGNESDYLDAIVACDVSGSMQGDPICASIGLAIYIAQRNKGRFHNHFIDFCGNSRMHKLPDDTSISNLVNYVQRSSTDMSTNIESVMIDALLNTAVENQIPNEELPKYVIIISDMEFNECGNSTVSNYEYWKHLYSNAGYELPKIIFWTVQNRHNKFPAKGDDNVILLSGSSQNGVKLIQTIDKYELGGDSLAVMAMIETINKYYDYLL